MVRTLLTLAVGVGLGVTWMSAAEHEEHSKNAAKTLAARDILEKLDGKEAQVTFVEVKYEAGQSGKPHRHPGPVFGYVLEGEFEWAIDDQPAKVFKAGETFYEPRGCLHRVSRSPAKAKGQTRVLAVIVHPRDTKEIVIPEPEKK
jgi:quercetin dioxygenase-like cupin family protein